MSQGTAGGHRWRAHAGGPASRLVSLRTQRMLWIGLVILLAGVIGWLAIKSWWTAVKATHVVAIGMTYDDPVFRPTPFAQQSANAFDELHDRDQTQVPNPVYKHENQLEGARFLNWGLPRPEELKDLNLLVYLNLQGVVLEQSVANKPAAAACFLTVKALPSSGYSPSDDQRVTARELLTKLGKLSEGEAANVVALLEVGDCGPNWRAGVLNRDFIAQLQQDAAAVCEEFPKLRVIGAVSPGESATSSITHGDGGGRTTFAHFAVQGLRGEANGWTYDSGTGKSTQERTMDRRVSFQELFAYLNESVMDWSVRHRGQRQTVWQVPSGGDRRQKVSELMLVQIRSDSQLKKLAEIAKPGAAKNKANESAAKDSGSKDGKSASGTSETDAKSKTSSGADSQDPSSKGKTNGESDAAKSENTKSETKKGADDSQPEPTPAEVLRRERLALQERLLELWRRRDQWRSDERALAAWLTPREWRTLQLQLVHAEQCWRAGHDPKRIGDELLKVEDAFREIEAQRGYLETPRTELIDALLSLANETEFDRFSSSPVAASQTPLTAEEQKKFSVLLKQAFPAAAEQPTPTPAPRPDPATTGPKAGTAEADKPTAPRAPQLEELRSLVRNHPELRPRVWQEALGPARAVARGAKDTGKTAAEDFAKLHELVDKASFIAGASSIPAELIAVSEISDTARTALGGEFEWSAGLSRACGQILELRVQWEEITSRNWAFHRWLREPLEDIDLKLVAAERWLRAGQSALAVSWLEDARSALAKVDSEAQILQRAVKLRATLCAELPDFARWVARRLESDGSAKRPLLRFAEARSKELKEELQELRSHHPALFVLFDLIQETRELQTLLSIGERDIAARGQEPAVASRFDFTGLAKQLGQLEKPWTDFRDGTFRSEVERLANDQTPNGDLWNRIDELLLVPWLNAEQRQQLVGQLERIDRQLGVGGNSIRAGNTARGAANTRGEWQAFWAIVTLRLAGLTPTIEKQLWTEFTNSLPVPESGNPSSEFIASAKLGSAIGKAFGAIATAADAEPTELLVRGADGADLPASDARGWFAKSSRQQVERAFKDRAAQVLKFAKLDDEGTPSRLAVLATRWTRLVRKPSVLSSDWAPLTLQGLDSRVLWWSKGETPEFALPLILSHRSGEKRAPGLLRFLDDGQAVEIRHGSETTRPAAEGISLKAGTDPQPVPLRLMKRPGTTTQDTIRLAVLDAQTKFPWEIRRLTLRVPSKAQDFRIEFRLKEELKTLSSLAIKDRNSDTSGPEKYRTELLLPTAPREQPLTLQPVLIVVNDTQVPSVTIRVFERDENGQPKSKSLAELKDVKLNSDGAPIPLKLLLPPAPLPAAVPATTATAPPAGPLTRDVSRGWIFQITTNTNEEFQQHVLPRVRPPETYFKPNRAEAFQVSFRDLELLARLQRETEIDAKFLPAKVKVELVLPPELRALNPNFDLIADVSRDAVGVFRARFAERDRAWLNQKLDQKQREFTIFFKVAGWPRAFPWRIRHDAEPTLEISPRPSIVNLRDGTVIRQGAPLPLEIQIDSDVLNREGLDEPWTLRGQLINVETSKTARSESQTIVRSRQEKIELVGQDEEGHWQFASSVAEHRLTFSTDGLRGQYRVEVEATPNKANTSPAGSGQSESVLVAIVPADHAPPTPRLTPRRTVLSFQTATKQDWRVWVDVSDPEAGIKEVAIGFDTDGDGKLSEKEFVGETVTWSNPLDQAEPTTVPLIVPFGKLPKTPGIYSVLVTARNGVDNLCVKPLKIDFTIEPPIGTVVVQVGNLGVRRYALVRRLAGGKNATEIQVVTGNQGDVSMDLPVGDYEFLLQRKSTGGVGPPEQVTVTEGQKTVITLDPALVP